MPPEVQIPGNQPEKIGGGESDINKKDPAEIKY